MHEDWKAARWKAEKKTGDNIKVDLWELDYDGVRWVQFALDCVLWRALI